MIGKTRTEIKAYACHNIVMYALEKKQISEMNTTNVITKCIDRHMKKIKN